MQMQKYWNPFSKQIQNKRLNKKKAGLKEMVLRVFSSIAAKDSHKKWSLK